MAITPSQVRHLVDRAVRIAREHRTVTCLVFPNDVQDMKAVPTPPREHGTVHSGIGRSAHALVPQEEELRSAAERCRAIPAGGDEYERDPRDKAQRKAENIEPTAARECRHVGIGWRCRRLRRIP